MKYYNIIKNQMSDYTVAELLISIYNDISQDSLDSRMDVLFENKDLKAVPMRRKQYLDFLRNTQLKQLEFDVIHINDDETRLIASRIVEHDIFGPWAEASVPFSNRGSNNGEVRGKALQDFLQNQAEVNGELTIEEALINRNRQLEHNSISGYWLNSLFLFIPEEYKHIAQSENDISEGKIIASTYTPMIEGAMKEIYKYIEENNITIISDTMSASSSSSSISRMSLDESNISSGELDLLFDEEEELIYISHANLTSQTTTGEYIPVHTARELHEIFLAMLPKDKMIEVSVLQEKAMRIEEQAERVEFLQQIKNLFVAGTEEVSQ